MAGKNLEIKPKSNQLSNSHVVKLQIFYEDEADKILYGNQDQYTKIKVEPFTSKYRFFLKFLLQKEITTMSNSKIFRQKCSIIKNVKNGD